MLPSGPDTHLESGQTTSAFRKKKERNKHFFILQTANTLNSHKDFIDRLKKQLRLQQVSTVDECDFILVFCPVVSRAGTDIEAALKKLNHESDTKPAVLVVLHHTFEPEYVVPESSRVANRKNMITVDCLFHEDKGLLQCHKNDESLSKTLDYINPYSTVRTEKQLETRINKHEALLVENQQLKEKLFILEQQLTEKVLAETPQTQQFEEENLEQRDTQIKPATPAFLKNEERNTTFFVLLTGDTLNSHKDFIDRLKKLRLQEELRMDECDFILVFCPVVSQAKTDIEAALKKLNHESDTKPAVLVVLHHTLDPKCDVPARSGPVHRKNTIRVDCLFHEDIGLLQCQKNDESLNRIVKYLNPHSTVKKNKEMETSKNKLETLGQKLQDKERQIQEMRIVLEQQKTELAEKNKQLDEKERLLTERETQLMERNKQLQEKDRLIEEKTKQLQEQTDPESSATIRRGNSKELLPPIMGGESSSPHSPVSVRVAELRLVLLGRTGSGKSAAGNAILSREERNQAATSPATSTSTPQSESTQGEVAGRKVTVVDTPDWFSPGLSLEKLRQDVGHCVQLSAPGPHAFLLVIPVKQPTGEESGMLEKMEEMFGERCWRNTIIIFSVTGEQQKKNIEAYIQSGDQEVQRLVEKCGNRFHCLNIKESGDGSQVSELLEKIEKMVEGSRENFYSSEIYLETESQIRAMETKILKSREDKRMREEMELKEKINKEVQDSLRKIEGVIQEHEGDIRQLDDRSAELERKMKEERDEEKKRELERELKRDVERRTEMKEKVKKLKEKRERERREMEERHQQEMEEIREVYEGEVRMETERNLMKIILPELQRNILASKTKMQEEFSRQMEEKNRELETLKQKLSDLTETHNVLEEVYERTVRSLESERAAVTGETSKGISQKFKDFFH